MTDERMRQAVEWAAKGPHPGEPSIEPGRAPGGMVYQTWADDVMLAEDLVRGDSPALPDVVSAIINEAAEASGERAEAKLAGGSDLVELRIFDGDTGAWVMTRHIFVGAALLRKMPQAQKNIP